MWLSRQIKIVMQQNSTHHDTHSMDESQKHCCNIGRKSCNRQNWFIATEVQWTVALGQERMDSRGHTGPVGVETVPWILTLVESHGAVYSVSVSIVICKVSLSVSNMEKKVGAFTLLLLCAFTLFEVWQWAFVTFTTNHFAWEEWGQGRGESCEHFWMGLRGWLLKLCATAGLDS